MLCLLLHFKATNILNFPKIHSCKDIQNEWDTKICFCGRYIFECESYLSIDKVTNFVKFPHLCHVTFFLDLQDYKFNKQHQTSAILIFFKSKQLFDPV